MSGSYSRLIAQLAVVTHTSPLVWDEVLRWDPRMLWTVVDVLKGGD